MKVKNLNLQPTALLAELVGTFILATVAITVANPIIVGFTLVVLVLALSTISGAHLNPAVTFGLWSIRKLEGVKVPFYFAMQFAGALLALLVSQLYQGGGYGISFASFNSLDSKILLAELLGATVFTFAIAASVGRNLKESAQGLCIGLALLTGLAVGGGLLGQALQGASLTAQKEAPRVTKVDGVIINPAIALAATEKAEQQSSLQSLTGQAEDNAESKRPASRLSWETIIGGLVGGALGMNLYAVTSGVNPFKKKETVATKVTKVVKKVKGKK